MRLSLGPVSVERQSGKPYFVDGYQLEPVAWVLRLASARVTVPWQGEPSPGVRALALVGPSVVRVTDPLGRRYALGFRRQRSVWRWLSAAMAAGVVAAVVRLVRRRDASR